MDGDSNTRCPSRPPIRQQMPTVASRPTQACSRGDPRVPGAFAALYDRHANAVFAAAMRVSRDSWIAAEVVQETFLALWNQAERFDPSRGPLTAWLQRIARNRTIDHLRSAGRHQRAGTFSSFSTATASGPAIDDWLTGSGELIAVAQPEAGPEAVLSSKERARRSPRRLPRSLRMSDR